MNWELFLLIVTWIAFVIELAIHGLTYYAYTELSDFEKSMTEVNMKWHPFILIVSGPGLAVYHLG